GMSATGPQTLHIPLSFLDEGIHEVLLACDNLKNPASVAMKKMTLDRKETLTVDLTEGGGFVARFVDKQPGTE
ncbi:hypothetical protein EHM92_02975, partial [bacterium]